MHARGAKVFSHARSRPALDAKRVAVLIHRRAEFLGLAFSQNLNRELVEAGVRVSSLRPAASSLEETYLTLMAEKENAGSAAN